MWSIQKKSLSVSRASHLSRPSSICFGLSILERVHHYLHFSCICFDKIDPWHFPFSTKVTLRGSVIVTILLKSLFRRTWQNLTGTKQQQQQGYLHGGCIVNSFRCNQCHFLSSQWRYRICLEGSQSKPCAQLMWECSWKFICTCKTNRAFQ